MHFIKLENILATFTKPTFYMAGNEKYALVTGATSGIGYELARIFAMNRYNLVIVSRNSVELDLKAKEFISQFGIKVHTLVKDLFELNAAHEIYEEIKKKGIVINVLVNDAGQGAFGHFTEQDITRLLNIVQLNVVAFTTLTYLFLKEMLNRDEGKILQVGSMVSKIPSPLGAVYSATKAYVLNFTEALISEVKNTNVTITILLPGVTDTDFFNKAGSGHKKFAQDKEKMLSPSYVAMAGYKGLMNGAEKVVPGLKNKVINVMSNIIPATVLADQLKKQSSK
jgi:short-subunit dehydrogenase